MSELSAISELAVKLAKQAGRFALKSIGDIGKISYKKTFNNLVTDIDKRCEEMIIKGINKNFPDHSILAEECGSSLKDGQFKWFIDPIDGTTNYAHAFPFFCTSIAVSLSGSTKIGVVFDPSRDELFTAEDRKGAFLNHKKIKVSNIDKVKSALVATGFAPTTQGKGENIAYFAKMLNKAQAVRRAGSAAMDLSYVACGRFDGFWEIGLFPWDTAAGELIVKEAGGLVTVFRGEPFNVFEKNILATNGLIHKEMIRLLSDKTKS